MTDELKKLIAGSYGDQDLEFAGHYNDIERAAKALELAFELDLGYEEYLQYHRDFLKGKSASVEYIDDQIEKVKDLSSYFTSD